MKCADKVAYKTRGEAYDFAKTIRIRSGGVYIYECSFCRQYHITHVRPERWRFKMENAKHYNFNNVTQ